MKPQSTKEHPANNALLKSRTRHTRIFCFMLIPLLAVTAPRWPENSPTHEIMEFWGHLFVSGGVLIRILSSVYIGGRKNESLITEGPFSVVRNPLYFGSFLAMTGVALTTGSLTFLAVMIVAFCLYYRVTVKREEAHLEAKFGARYRNYAARVPSWLPEPLLWEEPREIKTRPPFVRLAVMDASVFLLVVPLLEVLCELRENGVLPVFLTLP
jgi:protein-S-isoprenylcysteine O-methyltransferase Ste14